MDRRRKSRYETRERFLTSKATTRLRRRYHRVSAFTINWNSKRTEHNRTDLKWSNRPRDRQTDRNRSSEQASSSDLNDARMFSMNVGRRPSHGTMDGMKHHHTSRSVRKLSTDTGLSEKFPHWLGDGCQTSGVCDSAALSRRSQTFERIAFKLTSQIYAFVPSLTHHPPRS